MVFNGTPDTDKFRSVYYISAIENKDSKKGFICSGALVAPNVILTAKHCVTHLNPGGIRCAQGGKSGGEVHTTGLLDPELISISNDTEIDFKAQAHAKRIITTDSSTLCNEDIAFIVLDKEMKQKPYRIRTQSNVLYKEILTQVGYGKTQKEESGVKRFADVVVGCPNLYTGDREFKVVVTALPGDSGGPYIDDKGIVVGVASRGGPLPDNVEGTNTTTYGFHDMLQEVRQASGYRILNEYDEDWKQPEKDCY